MNLKNLILLMVIMGPSLIVYLIKLKSYWGRRCFRGMNLRSKHAKMITKKKTGL